MIKQNFLKLLDMQFRHDLTFCVVLSLFLVFGLASINTMLVYTPDSARYLAWAKSLAFFEGFKDATAPESQRYVVHAPLYSVLLAPVARFLPYSIPAAKCVTLLFGGFLLLLFYGWARNHTSPQAAAVGSLFLALNPLTILYSTQVLSEIPFACAIILAFLITGSLADSDGSDRTGEIVLVIVIAAGTLLREVGMTLAAGAGAFFLLQKQYRRAGLVVLFPLLLYLLWVVRNDVIVAPVENPAMTNARIFLGHFFTAPDAGILQEFQARVWTNLQVYSGFFGRLLLMPDYGERTYGMIAPGHPWVHAGSAVVEYLKYVFVPASIGLSLYGIGARWKSAMSLRAPAIFLILYPLPILLYPVSDMRFLFPVLVVMLFYAVLGADLIYRSVAPGLKGFARTVVFAGVAAVLLLPNAIWDFDFVYNNFDRKGLALTPSSAKLLPQQFRRTFDVAGAWIAGHSDPSTVVGSRWKELYCWLDGRKVLELGPQATFDLFDELLRDYNVRYLVCMVNDLGLREMEAQMASSRKFHFRSVYRIGSVEVTEVLSGPVGGDDPLLQMGGHDSILVNQGNIRREFHRAVRLLHQWKPAEAESLFKRLSPDAETYSAVQFYTGVAKELGGNYGEALALYQRLRSMPQAGAYLQLASYHQNVIALTREAESGSPGIARANNYLTAAQHYWNMGFRNYALHMVQRSLQADSSFFPAIVIGSVYWLLHGDTAASRHALVKARAIDRSNTLVEHLSSIFLHADSLRIIRSSHDVRRHRLAIAGDFIAMGMRDNAAAELLELLDSNPDDFEVMRLLAGIYEVKERYYSEVKILRRLMELRPGDESVRKKLDELGGRW